MLKLWRRLTGRSGPDCDRCGQPTMKPFLYRQPRTWWRCEPCEQAVTDILFAAAEQGTLAEDMLRYTRPPAEPDPLHAAHEQLVASIDFDVEGGLAEILKRKEGNRP